MLKPAIHLIGELHAGHLSPPCFGVLHTLFGRQILHAILRMLCASLQSISVIIVRRTRFRLNRLQEVVGVVSINRYNGVLQVSIHPIYLQDML